MSDSADARWLLPGRALAYRWWALTRGMTLGVRAVVLNAHDEVCLVRHGYISGWHLPGGGVEHGEAALDALARELDEEAGIAWSEAPILHGLFFNERMRARDHVAVYVVRAFRVMRPHTPGAEIREMGFFPLSELPDGTTGPVRRRIAEVQGLRPVDPRW